MNNMKKKSQRMISGGAKDALYDKPKPSELLKGHFEETPKEELDKEWEDIKPLNDIGPDVEEYGRLWMLKDSCSNID